MRQRAAPLQQNRIIEAPEEDSSKLRRYSKGYILFKCLQVCLVLVLAASLFLIINLIRINQGTGGANFPDMTKDSFSSAVQLEVVATLSEPPGNVAVSKRGRVFFTFHPEFNPSIHLAEWIPAKSTFFPFPDLKFQRKFSSPLAVRVDEGHHGTHPMLYCLDHGHHGVFTPTLYGFDLASRDSYLKFKFEFPKSVAGLGSFLNDFVISPEGQYIYIADSSILGGSPALIVMVLEINISICI
jgi:hypothetical protein